MIAILIYPKDVTRIIKIPKGISKIEDIQDYLLNTEDIENRDQAIIKNKFYEYNMGKWELISNSDAEANQATYGQEKGLGKNIKEKL